MSESYDVAIIGGGPAGSTVATMLSRAGRRVVVFEKEKFPRFHVGESLLPYSLPIFERLGVHEKIRAHGFQEKYGAFFWNEATGGTRPVDFGNAEDDRHPMAYQVKRAEFDQILLSHSESPCARRPVRPKKFGRARSWMRRVRRPSFPVGSGPASSTRS